MPYILLPCDQCSVHSADYVGGAKNGMSEHWKKQTADIRNFGDRQQAKMEEAIPKLKGQSCTEQWDLKLKAR